MREIKIDFIHHNAGRNYVGSWSKYCDFTEDGRVISKHGIIRDYTGFKDSNGKEIYEGDIIQGSRNTCGGKVYFIEWNIDNSLYMSVNRYTRDISIISQAWFNNYETEVVGNIFENPELT